MSALSKKQVNLLAANLLRMASEQFTNHGCNDFDLAELIPEAEVRGALLVELYGEDADDYEISEKRPDWNFPDWLLMNYCADQLDPEVREDAQPIVEPTNSPEENAEYISYLKSEVGTASPGGAALSALASAAEQMGPGASAYAREALENWPSAAGAEAKLPSNF